MLDRYGKFGRLAPKYDIGRNFNKMEKKIRKQIMLQQKRQNTVEEKKEGSKEEIENNEALTKEGPVDLNLEAKKRLEELNYYDLDDSFINDEDDISDEELEENTLTLDLGLYTEAEVLKNLEKNKKRRGNNNSNNSLPQSAEGLPKITQISNENIIINDDTNDKKSVNADPISDELNSFYKKFIDTNNLPIEPKDKYMLIKKLNQIYKKFREDKEKSSKLYDFVIEKTAFKREDIMFYFEFEFLKNKKEGIFSSLSKTYNKLIQFTNEKKINEINLNKTSNELKEKLSSITQKSTEYLLSAAELNDYIVANLERDSVFETLISGYKSHQISPEESKEKIFKKFRELLTKNQIKFEETLFEEILKLDYKNNSVIVDEEVRIVEEKKNEEIEGKPESILIQDNMEKSEGIEELVFVFKVGNLPVRSNKYYTKKYSESDFICPENNN